MSGILSILFLCAVEILLANKAVNEREKHSYWE